MKPSSPARAGEWSQARGRASNRDMPAQKHARLAWARGLKRLVPDMAMSRSILLVAALLVGGTPLRADVTRVDNVGLQRLIDRGVPVVDIRTPEEWHATGVIEGSHLLTFFDAQGRYKIHAWLSELASIASRRDDPLVLICDSGGRSALVSQYLDAQLGYRYVFDVPGGIAQWMAENRPTVEPR